MEKDTDLLEEYQPEPTPQQLSDDKFILDIIGQYLQEVRREELLTDKQERKLGDTLKKARRAQAKIDLGNYKDGQLPKLEKSIRKGILARDEFVKHNLRLVISVAKRYQHQGLPFIDLIQEGNLGLITVANKFDVDRGVKFATYAVWWIRQGITRALGNQSRTIRFPISFAENVRKLRRQQSALQQKLDRPPTIEELSLEMGWAPAKVRRTLARTQQPLSLNTKFGTGRRSGVELGDTIPDTSAHDPEESVSAAMLRDDLASLLENLPDQQRRVLSIRYGIIDGEPQSLSEIGRRMGISRERVRQVHNAALERLRAKAEEENLEDYMTE